MANGNGEQQRGAIMTAIFTEKVVGIGFAIAFGLWAWYLDGLAETVMDGVEVLRQDNKELTAEIHQVKSEMVTIRLQMTQQMVQFQERQEMIRRRLDEIDQHHREEGKRP